MKITVNKKMIFLIAVFTILLLLVIFLFMVFGDTEEEPVVPPGSVEQPVGQDNGTKVDIDRDVSDQVDDVEEINIYKVGKDGHVSNVRDFVQGMGKSDWFERSYTEGFYLWQRTKTENYYVIDYDTLTETLTFIFPEPVSTDRFTGGSELSDEEIDVYMESFFREYLGLQFKFENIHVSSSRDGFTIEANRSVDGYPLHTRGVDEFSDRLQIDKSGRVISGRLLLMNYNLPGAKVELIDPGLVGSVINRSDYPKDFHQLAPVGFEQDYPEVDISNPNFYGDAISVPDDEYVQQVSSCVAESMEIVYFFFTTDSDELSPTYKINCSGEAEIGGDTYEIPVIVYTSAIDPDLVYVP